MRFFAVEDKPSRQGTAQLPQAGERLLAGRVTAYAEGALVSDPNLYIVALFQFKRLDHCGWQANGQTVSPFRNLHRPPWIYIFHCISIGRLSAIIPYTIGPSTMAIAPPIKANLSLPRRATKAITTGAATT